MKSTFLALDIIRVLRQKINVQRLSITCGPKIRKNQLDCRIQAPFSLVQRLMVKKEKQLIRRTLLILQKRGKLPRDAMSVETAFQRAH